MFVYLITLIFINGTFYQLNNYIDVKKILLSSVFVFVLVSILIFLIQDIKHFDKKVEIQSHEVLKLDENISTVAAITTSDESKISFFIKEGNGKKYISVSSSDLLIEATNEKPRYDKIKCKNGMRYSYWLGVFVKDEDELCDAPYKEVLYIPNGSVINLK